MKKFFYITTTLPYVNADPHIGFALEIVQADVLARYHRLLQEEVFFNTGTDEHGIKIYRRAQEEGKDPKEYVDEYAEKFKKLKEILNLSFNNFIRTTNKKHQEAAKEFWKRCLKKGDIYKAKQKIKYCVGCFKCWFKHPGKCIHDDDMLMIRKKIKAADIIVFGCPVYFDGFTAQMKTMLDRLIAGGSPFIENRDGHARHPSHGKERKVRDKVYHPVCVPSDNP